MATSKRRNVNGPQSNTPTSAPRLGTVIRVAPRAGKEVMKAIQAAGMRVASSSDFKRAAAVPNDFGGADVQYFERFGIAIVRGQQAGLKGFLARGLESRSVQASRPERLYRALGSSVAPLVRTTQSGMDPDYIAGYRDGVVEFANRILGSATAEDEAGVAAAFDETLTTWGLQATRVDVSRLSGRGIKVAVLDTGFEETHPDFVGRQVTKKLFASGSSEDDIHGHGTHCVGTACGPKMPNGAPRYGVAHDAHIFAGKVLGDDGFGTDRSIIAGMDWAVEQGCEVISMSLGAATSIGDQPSEDYEQIGQVCLDSGTVVIAAAGNESERPGLISPVGSPANASTILAVGAVDRRIRVADFSCGGLNPNQAVDIVAPGVDILSSFLGGGHRRLRGTSMATPHVAGIAALLAESDKSFRGWALWARVLQLAKHLRAPTRDVGKGLAQAPLK